MYVILYQMKGTQRWFVADAEFVQAFETKEEALLCIESEWSDEYSYLTINDALHDKPTMSVGCEVHEL